MRSQNGRRPAIGGILLFIAVSLAAVGGAGKGPQLAAPLGGGHTGAASPDVSRYAPGYGGIVFTQIPVARVVGARSSDAGMLRASYGDGGRLVLLSKDGSTRVLTADLESAADPAVSFDGKRVLFAAKRTAADRWNIFEMKADGSDIHQITRDSGNCRSPMYQSALFYLNDERPSYQVTFVSDLASELNEYGPPAATNLYSMRFDGSRLRRLTYGVSASYDPFQMQDGRILFSHWERSHLRNGVQGRIDLFAVHLDGTDYAAFSGTQGPRIKHMACTTSKGAVVFVESGGIPWDGAGSIGVLSLRRNLHSYRAITAPPDGLFHSPSPLPDGSILVSRRSLDGGAHAIYRLDLETGTRALVFEQPGYHSMQAVALAERPEPDGHSSVVEDDQNWSKLYCLSVYENDLKREWMPLGTARRIRVIEGLTRAAGTFVDGSRAAVDSLSGMIQKRLLGDVELDDDGSFHLLVPPNTPIQLQMVDRDGMALRTSAWIWAKNKENRGCIGCHEDGERTPENVFAKALGHDAAELMLPAERRRTVDFRRDIQPILTAKCASRTCHGGATSPSLSETDAHHGPGNADFSPAYLSLLARPATPAYADRGKYVDPGRARTSRLVWAIFGKNTARPWDGTEVASAIKRMPPAGSAPLTEEERGAIVEWIDLGAQFNGLPSDRSNARAGASRGQP
jgi:Tol biopolymer transport system component